MRLSRRCEYECELRDPVGQPAEDVDGDDGEDEPRNLPVGLAPLLGLVLRPHRLQLDDDQDVEGEDEHEGHREAQDEAVEGERRLAVEDALRWVAHLQQCLWLPCEMNALHFSSEIDVMNFAFCWRVD